MECQSIHLLLHEALDRLLTGEEQARLDEHLAACPACRADAVIFRAVIQAIEEAPLLQPSADFTVKVMDRLPTPIHILGRIPVAVFRAFVTAIGIIAMAIGWVYRTPLLQTMQTWSSAATGPNPILVSFQHAAASIYGIWTTMLGYIPTVDTQRLMPVFSVLIAIGVAHVILQMVDAFEPVEFDSVADQPY